MYHGPSSPVRGVREELRKTNPSLSFRNLKVLTPFFFRFPLKTKTKHATRTIHHFRAKHRHQTTTSANFMSESIQNLQTFGMCDHSIQCCCRYFINIMCTHIYIYITINIINNKSIWMHFVSQTPLPILSTRTTKLFQAPSNSRSICASKREPEEKQSPPFRDSPRKLISSCC